MVRKKRVERIVVLGGGISGYGSAILAKKLVRFGQDSGSLSDGTRPVECRI